MQLLLTYGLILTVLPAALLILLAGRIAPTPRGLPLSNRNTSRFLLVSAVAVLLPFAILTNHLFTDFAGMLALLFVPVLIGVWALAIINGRGIRALLDTDRALVVACLVLWLVLLTASGLGQRQLPLTFITASLIVALAWWAVRRLRGGILVAAALLCGLLLVLDASGLASSPAVYEQPALFRLYRISGALFPLLALACAALLVRAALSEGTAKIGPHGPIQEGSINVGETRRRQATYLVLAGLVLLSLCAAVYRSAVMVNATGYALEDHLPFLTVAAAVIIGVFLALMGGKRSHYAGIAFAFIASLAIVVAYQLGGQADPQAVTHSRGERIVQALREYHNDTGAYPEGLEQLTPGYLPILLGPLNGRGQRWCYQGRGNSFRLGYVLFQRYSKVESYTDKLGLNIPELRFSAVPSYSIEVIARDGDLKGSWMCSQELRRMQATGGL